MVCSAVYLHKSLCLIYMSLCCSTACLSSYSLRCIRVIYFHVSFTGY
uniref:Uncharacterized protein n=1 Tax=Rhizophora mucronata TaxID=61149 RepID=A0A2P2NKE3_RHIMU